MPQLTDAAKDSLVAAKPAFESAWDRWDGRRDEDEALTAYRAVRDEWVPTVLREVMGWGELLVTDDPTVVTTTVHSPDGVVTVRPTMSMRHEDQTGALVWVIDPVDDLRDPLTDGWATSPIDRMEQMLTAADVGIGVVTDGRWWALVSNTAQGLPASGVVDAQTWVEETATRNAVMTLLSPRHLVGGRPEDRLSALFAESVLSAESITESLGVQVRAAVELIVQALSEASSQAQAQGEADPLPADADEIYDAAVTVMMRIVFLLFAEERGLVPEDQLFALGYGLSDRFDVLDSRARREGEEALDSTHLTWHRLLATSRALHRGATFEDMRLPAYGGSLFDSDRFTFLTATGGHGTLRISVSDRVMWHVLRSVQVAEVKGQPARRVSFRDIDVEQIGYIYEGLLGYTCRRAESLTVGLKGKAGAEPEMTVDTLDEMAEEHMDDRAIAGAIRDWAKDHQPASVCPSLAALAKHLGSGDTMEDAERALRAVTDDAAVRERLRPWIGVIRRDLRGRPVVVPPGGLVVTETPSRRNAGAHYTPKALAEEVVLHALEPLCYRPGPHQTVDRDHWQRLSSNEILDLKVADIACGSGAFLVAAAHYLASRLVEAWQAEGTAVLPPHELKTKALREVVAQCLYGADINAMAVEMCKLSLWLVSLDRDLPFAFVDDKILHGNSLLGLTSLRQLEAVHISPSTAKAQGRMEIAGDRIVDPLDASVAISRAISLRRQLATEVDDSDPQRTAAAKRRQLATARGLTSQLSLVADGVIAAGLTQGGKPGKALDEAYENLRLAVGSAFPEAGEGDASSLESIVDRGLTPTVDTDYARWKPLHWILEVPDVMEHGGFDAVVGNPPFVSGLDINAALGKNFSDLLRSYLANAKRGRADLSAYFFLRSEEVIRPCGNFGLIATSTLSKGDTRRVCLVTLQEGGATFFRSKINTLWPAKNANVHYSALWVHKGQLARDIERVCDGVRVGAISSTLEGADTDTSLPLPLGDDSFIAYNGCYVNGKGFELSENEARRMIAADPDNRNVIRRYLTGTDLNLSPDSAAGHWIIDFNAMPLSHAEKYVLPFERVRTMVYPQRAGNNRKGIREKWWQYADKRPALRRALEGEAHCIAVRQSSRIQIPVTISGDQVIDQTVIVFTPAHFDLLAILNSSHHQLWALKYGLSLGTAPRYTPSDVFDTFPRPRPTQSLSQVGQTLDQGRREIMLRRDLGLTKLYNLVNDPDIDSAADRDVARVRELHVAVDEAVMAAYGWDDVPLEHGFHTYRQMQRWTVSPAVRVEILDRLLEENHCRAARQGDTPLPPDDDVADVYDDASGEGEL